MSEPELEPGSGSVSEAAAETTALAVDDQLDLRGEVCPYTFVKAKLALEELSRGQVLRILLDHRPAVDNVPRSLRAEGQEVLHVGETRRAASGRERLTAASQSAVNESEVPAAASEWEVLVRKRV